MKLTIDIAWIQEIAYHLQTLLLSMKMVDMTDDMRTWDNEVVIDATEEEIKEYRKAYHKFKIGDKVKINRGRKMLGEIKEIKGFYTFRPDRTYGHCDTNYLVFTDNTKVNKLHCDII